MKEDKLNQYLSSKSKEQLQNIILNHYKFIVNKIEHLQKEYEEYRNKGMNNLAECVHDEKEFIMLQLKWYENYIKEDIKQP